MWLFAINGSQFIHNPWETITGPFIGLLGSGFYLIPVSFIAMALYVKTRNIVTVSAFIIASGALLSSVSMFSVYPEMSFVYMVVTGIGIAALVLGLVFSIRR